MMNKLAPEIASGRSVHDLKAFQAYCDLSKIPAEARPDIVAAARKRVEGWLANDQTQAGIRQLAEALLKQETIEGPESQKQFQRAK
jgi:hypothetical protein